MELTNDYKVLLKKSQNVFRAINHKLRQSIYNYLLDGKKSQTEILQHLSLKQSVASRQLQILLNAGWVQAERVGKNIYYSVNNTRVELFSNCAKLIAS